MSGPETAQKLDVRHQALIHERFEGGPGRVVRLSVELSAEPERAWQAMTTPSGLSAWLGATSGELRSGGSFSVADNASGRIIRCDPPHVLEIDWDFDGAHSVVEAKLAPSSGGSILALSNAMPDVEDEHWGTFGPGAAGVGWQITLLALQYFVVTGQAFDDEHWTASADGALTIEKWSEEWAAVHRSAGATEREAKAAGKETANFYLGNP